MQNICQLSRRWHQQFCRSALFAGHQRCLQQLQPIRCYRQATKGRKDSGGRNERLGSELVVREYDQLGTNPRNRVLIDRRLEQHEETIWQQRIQELEDELAVLRQGPFGRDSELMRSLPHDEREEVLKALEKDGLLQKDGDDLIESLDLDSLLEDTEDDTHGVELAAVPSVTLRIPQRQKTYVRQFNKAIESVVQSDQDPHSQLNLWKWYLRCQQHVPGFSDIVSEEVWSTLWVSQTSTIRRPKHIIMLARDMLTAHMQLQAAQWVTYIEALLDNGDTAAAMATWEQHKGIVGPDPFAASDFWSLGVRLYALMGKTQQAQNVALECLDQSSTVSPRILIRVISAWAQSSDASASTKAWALYLRLRAELGDQIDIDIYDSVSSTFLQAGRSDLALAVFKDMVLAERKSPDDSRSIYNRILGQVVDAHQRSVSENQINQVSLAALTILPKRYQNKFFFGSWIKRLIGQDDLDGASSVVELMYERGIKLDAKHLNGLVGAWLRQGSPAARDKAERMAWAMLDARVRLVRSRPVKIYAGGSRGNMMSRTILAERNSKDIPSFLRRGAPAASIETFSILLQHYTRRMDLPSADQVTNIMTGPAQLTPNAFIMNHWLYSALRSSDTQGVWDKYSALKNDIKPDLETFAALWDAAKVQYDQSRAAHGKNFPSARLLFAEMSGWLESLPEKKSRAARGDFSRELYDQVVRCFCFSSDMHGMLCAMQGLQNLFGLWPDENAMRMCMIQVARILPLPSQYQATGRRGSRRKLYQQKDAMDRVAGIVEKITEERGLVLFEKGVDPGSLEDDSEVASELRLAVLTDFLMKIMETSKQNGGDVKNEVRNVAKIMKVDLGGVGL